MVENFNYNFLKYIKKKNVCKNDKIEGVKKDLWEKIILSWIHFKIWEKTEITLVLINYFQKKINKKNFEIELYLNNFFLFNTWKELIVSKNNIKIKRIV